MRILTLVLKNLNWYWRSNIAVVAGVAIAVAVLAGAMAAGNSVKESLRDLILARLGRTDYAVTSTGMFREQLAVETSGVPILLFEGLLTHQKSGRRASKVDIYGVDERFWKFNQYPNAAPKSRDIFLSGALARELESGEGESVLVRVEKPSAIPKESLHGKKEDSGATMRFITRASNSVEFSMRPRQGALRAAFVPLSRVQQELEQEEKANTILYSGSDPTPRLNEKFELADLDLRVKRIGDFLQLESSGGYIGDATAQRALEIAAAMNLRAQPLVTYLANGMRVGAKQVPYSLVTAIDLPEFAGVEGSPILLNEWAARDLNAHKGDSLHLEYYVWKQEGRLETSASDFNVAGIVPTAGGPGDRDMAPEYPGITETDSLRDWDPPFPMNLKLIRPSDEDYWKRYRTLPKAFIPLAKGQELWKTRFGKITSIRFRGDLEQPFAKSLRYAIHPGFTVTAVRSQGLNASNGSTDFGEYFTYFSFFLMVSALMLASLFFRLGVIGRLREIGLLRALGFDERKIRTIFLLEGLFLSAAGSIIGMAGAVAYAGLIMYGLRTWWVGAVGTTELKLHVSPEALIAGGVGGIIAAIVAIALSLRGLRGITPRGMIAGPSTRHQAAGRFVVLCAAFSAIAAVGLLVAAPAPAGFFGAGSLGLIALLCYARIRLGRVKHPLISSQGLPGILRLGLRSASERPGRSVLSIALIASACFLLVSLNAFRHSPGENKLDAKSGNGGFPLLAESMMPLYNDISSASGSAAYNLAAPVRAISFRLKPGDDASCLNLYQPGNPKVLGAPESFLKMGRFAFAETIQPAANPWLLLNQAPTSGAIPAAADLNSMLYVLHKKLGEEVVVDGVRLKLVAALSNSIFQSELIISEANFIRAFPVEQGFRFFLLDDAPKNIEDALSDFGFDVTSTGDRLAQFHSVENTYLATFQSLGAMGLLLGVAGLAAVLLRNAFERRRELALLRATGYSKTDLGWKMLSENLFLLLTGAAFGAVSALMAVTPALQSRGSQFGFGSTIVILIGVIVVGTAASLAATRFALQSPLLEALRSE